MQTFYKTCVNQSKTVHPIYMLEYDGGEKWNIMGNINTAVNQSMDIAFARNSQFFKNFYNTKIIIRDNIMFVINESNCFPRTALWHL